MAIQNKHSVSSVNAGLKLTPQSGQTDQTAMKYYAEMDSVCR